MSEKVVVTGARGFLGRALVPSLQEAGYTVVTLGRRAEPAPGVDARVWDGATLGPWVEAIADAAAIVNLAGETINQRWTPDAKREILDSRVSSARVLGEALRGAGRTGVRWINASATGFYGDCDETPVNEESEPGTGFLAKTCRVSESAAVDAAVGQQLTRLRIGMVLGPDGGALPVLLRLARVGLGGAAGTGRQGVSWIHRDDIVGLIRWILALASPPPVVNAVSPHPLPNREFMAELRRAVRMPIGVPAPGFGIRLAAPLLGTEAELVLTGSFVHPRVAAERGYAFRRPTLAEALRELR